MKTKKEIKKWLLENCVNENGDLDFSAIDLSDFKGKVILKGWKIGGFADLSFWEVKGNLYQNGQKVNGSLYQHCQEVNGDLYQDFQIVNGNLDQSCQSAKNINQSCQKVKGNLYQSWQTAENLDQSYQNVSKDLVSQKLKEDEEWIDFQGNDCAVIRAKKLKEISKDELAEMGYKLKE